MYQGLSQNLGPPKLLWKWLVRVGYDINVLYIYIHIILIHIYSMHFLRESSKILVPQNFTRHFPTWPLHVDENKKPRTHPDGDLQTWYDDGI